MALSVFRNAPRFWERRGPTSLLLWPLAYLYGCILRIRKIFFDLDIARPKPAPVPIIIVGNIRVGGTGKTPIVIALAEHLSQLGWKPAIISRGYGSSIQKHPLKVKSYSDPSIVGDEPVLIAKRTHDQFPIWVFPIRKESIRALLKENAEVNVIISDDGLQHRGLVRWPAREGGRDIEFVVRDSRGEGNRFLLPAGPLREPASRDRDATLNTNISKPSRAGIEDEYFQGRRAFNLVSRLDIPYQLNNPTNTQSYEQIAERFLPKSIAMVAGLGNPKRFFDDLVSLGVIGQQFPMPDHVNYTPEFFEGIKADCILITEKDAVKCANIRDDRIWVAPISLQLPGSLVDWMQSILQRPDPRRYTL